MNELIVLLKKYIDTRTEIVKIDIEKEATRLVGKFFKLLIFGFLAMMIVIFIGLSLAFLIGDKLDRMYMGFLVVTGFFLLFLAFVYQNSDKIDAIITIFFQTNKSKKNKLTSTENTTATTSKQEENDK